MWEGCALNFVQRRAIARTQWVEANPLGFVPCLDITSDRVYEQHDPAVGDDLYAALAHPLYRRSHAIHEASLLVFVACESHTHAFVHNHPLKVSCNLRLYSSRPLKVIDVVIWVAGNISQRFGLREKCLHCVLV